MIADPHNDGVREAGETAPGVRYLKAVWGISSHSKAADYIAPEDVNTDIYAGPSRRSVRKRSRR